MRRLFLSLALGMALFALTATTALGAPPVLGGAQKAPFYGPFPITSCETGAIPTSQKFGFVVLNTSGNELELSGEISLKRASTVAAGFPFKVFVEQSPGLCPTGLAIGEVTINKQGNGNFHFIVPRFPGSTHFWVRLEGVAEELASSAVTLD
jgi:hypothetical protein